MVNIRKKRYVVLSAGLVLAMSADISVAQNLLKYTVSEAPLLKIAKPKPNIYMLLDDSTSMYDSGTNKPAYMTVREDFYGPGDPVCESRTGSLSAEWNALVARYKKMEEAEGGKYYDPFKSGSYVPYLISKNGSSGISEDEFHKYIGAIPIERCFSKVYRTEAVAQMVPEILEKYSKRANFGYGGLGKKELPLFRINKFSNGAPAGYPNEQLLAKLRKNLVNTGKWDLESAKVNVSSADVKDDINYNVFIQPIKDMSKNTPDEWARVKLDIARNIMGEHYKPDGKKAFLLGHTPTFNAAYNVALYFRGFNIVKSGYKAPGYVFERQEAPRYYLREIEERFSSKDINIDRAKPENSYIGTSRLLLENSVFKLFGTEKVKEPIKRYRCTTNSLFILTDGNSTDSRLGIVAKADLKGNGGFLATNVVKDIDGTHIPDLNNLSDKQKAVYEREKEGTFHFALPSEGYSFQPESERKALNKVIAREFTQASMMEGTYEDKDAAGKGWTSDKFGITQKLQVNSVRFGEEKFNKDLEALTEESGGQLITLGENASATAIIAAMDKIISDLIRSTSNAQVATSQFQKTDNSIRYTFKYNIESRRGEVIAHKADKKSDTGWAEYDKDGEPISLWRSETSILPSTGRFITMSYKGSIPQPAPINWDSVNSGYKIGTDESYLHSNHIGWLNGNIIVDDISLPSQKRVYRKLSPIGSFVNSNVVLFSHDVEYINLRNMGGEVKNEFNDYVLYKKQTLNKDYMIINANDGMVNFLSVPRSSPDIETELANGTKFVERSTAYFPGILAYRLPKLSGLSAEGYSIDGVVRLFEFKDSRGDIRSVGLSAFGAGGKGLVGYQLFKATPDSSRSDKFKDPDSVIKPLFEISNESKWNKYGDNTNFKNLGYTFSDFGFFNQSHPTSTGGGRGIAVFGNGYGETISGNAPSSLYFIDVETGAFIKEIILNDNGGGASSPALVVEKLGDYQTLKKIYVGDVSGQLYRITFADDLSHTAVEVLYKPLNAQYNPITVKPLVVLDNGDEWVYFGTGRKSDKSLDRGKSSPSKHTQYIVGLKNPKTIDDQPLTIDALHQNKLKLTDEIEVEGAKEKRKIQTVETKSVSTGTEKLELGWYLALDKDINKPLPDTSGERVVFSPKQSYNDVIFATWGIDEYDVVDDDPCVEDYAYGKILVLNKKTGLIGTGKIQDKAIGGFIVDNYTPGMPSGYGIMEGRVSGEFSGRSTLDKKTVEELNKATDSSHAAAEKKICFGIVSDDFPNLYDFTVTCPPNRVLSPRKLSIQKIN